MYMSPLSPRRSGPGRPEEAERETIEKRGDCGDEGEG